MNFEKIKIYIIGSICIGSFIAGRACAPKPKPEIKIIDNSKSIEKAIAETKKQMTQDFQKQVVLETHTVRSKSGSSKTDVKELITYKRNSVENINEKTRSDIKTTVKQSTEVKQKDVGIDYTFMVGRSFSDVHYDYFASIGVPLFTNIKANAGVEFHNKRFFLGTTVSF